MEDGGPGFRVAQDAVPHWFREIEAVPIVLQTIDQAKALLVVTESGHDFGQRAFTGMSKGCVSKIVPHPDRFDEILIQRERTTDSASDLRHLERVCQAGPVMIAVWADKNLGLVHEPPEAFRVYDPVAVALELRAHRR
jgi:hypothetical protein